LLNISSKIYIISTAATATTTTTIVVAELVVVYNNIYNIQQIHSGNCAPNFKNKSYNLSIVLS